MTGKRKVCKKNNKNTKNLNFLLTFPPVEGLFYKYRKANRKNGGVMKINQVEELVGITKKNIRFYEEQGLINPKRNPENGYREYNLDDVGQLMKIKLLRKLAVPIEEIHFLQTGEITFAECMDKQKIRLNHEKHCIELTEKLCEKIADEVDNLSKLDASEYLSEMKHMEEGGTRFMDITQKDIKQKKKKYASYIAAFFMMAVMSTMIGLLLWGNNMEPIPIGILLCIIAAFATVIVGVAAALKMRLKEINGGEENEASKY